MEVGANLSAEGVVLHNLKSAMYKMSVESLAAQTTSMTAHGNLVFVGVANHGIQVYRLEGSEIKLFMKLPGSQSVKSDKKRGSCYEIHASPNHLVYIRVSDQVWLCVHSMDEILEEKTDPLSSVQLSQKAALVLEPQLKLLVIGGAAWTQSWTGDVLDTPTEGSQDMFVRVLSINTLSTVKHWKAVNKSVSFLRNQLTSDHSLLGVSDSHDGLKVYDLRQPTDSEYVCLYHVDVNEVRNFYLVGDYIAVFHKFEPNVSFWNMKENRTILCINIQDQMKEMAEEFLEEDEVDEVGLFNDDDDFVTAVTGVPSDNDYVLIYGTKSGCVFGISVQNRSKLFNIPCPHEAVLESPSERRDIQAIMFIGPGKLLACYVNYGFTVLDFSPVNPPDRPPTRSQTRSMSEQE